MSATSAVTIYSDATCIAYRCQEDVAHALLRCTPARRVHTRVNAFVGLLARRVITGPPVRRQLGEPARWNHLDLNLVKTPVPGLVLGRIIQHVPVAEVDDDLLREVRQSLSVDRDQAAPG